MTTKSELELFSPVTSSDEDISIFRGYDCTYQLADRFVVYFRRLNAVTRIDSYPLPRIDDALDALNGIKYLTTIDLMYWQLEMEPK